MSKVTFTSTFVILVVFLYIAVQETESSDTSLNLRKEKQLSPMWFGPRFGRKKRNQDIRHNRNEKDDDNLIDILKESPLVVVAVRDAGKDFTPRLGRESGENNPNWFEDGDFMESEPISNRASNHFNPRLGRSSFSQFSPRLGRELD